MLESSWCTIRLTQLMIQITKFDCPIAFGSSEAQLKPLWISPNVLPIERNGAFLFLTTYSRIWVTPHIWEVKIHIFLYSFVKLQKEGAWLKTKGNTIGDKSVNRPYNIIFTWFMFFPSYQSLRWFWWPGSRTLRRCTFNALSCSSLVLVSVSDQTDPDWSA